MKINYNLSAMITNTQLLKNEKGQQAATERLASGLKINHAKDNPAGMAISHKMRQQIDGIMQASKNSADGISVIQTAEGCLNEVASILQRMKELSVQSANGTNSIDEREAIQQEIDSLNAEIDRISKNTEFNKKNLLDGSLSRRSYTDNLYVDVKSASEAVTADKYELKILADARQAVIIGNDGNTPADNKIPATAKGTITINGASVEIGSGETAQEVYSKLRQLADQVDVRCDITDGTKVSDGTTEETAQYKTEADYDFTQKLLFVSKEYGSDEKVEISVSNNELANILGLDAAAEEGGIACKGVDAQVKLENTKDTGFKSSATATVKGNEVTVTDFNGFKMEIKIRQGICKTDFNDKTADPADTSDAPEALGGDEVLVTADVTDIGMMTVHLGANENQILDADIPEVSVESLGLDKLNVLSEYTSGKAMDKLDAAINKVSEARSRLGAYQNRLEHTVASLDETEEDMTSALSRITDADMAEEMTEFTQYSVLTQAATSVLAQANDLPQQALQLLQ